MIWINSIECCEEIERKTLQRKRNSETREGGRGEIEDWRDRAMFWLNRWDIQSPLAPFFSFSVFTLLFIYSHHRLVTLENVQKRPAYLKSTAAMLRYSLAWQSIASSSSVKRQNIPMRFNYFLSSFPLFFDFVCATISLDSSTNFNEKDFLVFFFFFLPLTLMEWNYRQKFDFTTFAASDERDEKFHWFEQYLLCRHQRTQTLSRSCSKILRQKLLDDVYPKYFLCFFTYLRLTSIWLDSTLFYHFCIILLLAWWRRITSTSMTVSTSRYRRRRLLLLLA